ncbi:MAG: N-6 DNA methylase [Candidatus Tectomicrobia bacterium]|nr:N-6 DNA methylase [Candidatus Tectomicrobia bacterium]
MLDADTKHRIDTACDILVGKVPDPKSQVEQITIALIYKFMDDIDAEAEELGGQRRFFAGDFARYGWPRLVRAGLGGHEVINLYDEAITRMPENPGIPALFRDIFNNAYLPYRDPETLRAFLKVIDTFTYDHSERLGDAFEYLLSVLGSQGKAGQFRTPRHIIDFMVTILDPKKDEAILDPACGTAGFLVSSYKHILNANTDTEGNSTLTPDEKARLAANFKGYDISPDMVRLSLVNLYLHGFVEPHIAEYDTLTSEERWNEYADLILANPPFMSPKGGIRPHRRFSVQSKRSEVLFVDYMAEHLTPTGRAAIIVPEGIIFQGQTAHKQLRKMLVENYLVAVISLPAGVFQPYSGVKTSILILDKMLARRTQLIAFFKVENDGFDLGAQRRGIAENDLPQVAQAVKEYLNMHARDGRDQEDASCPSFSPMLQDLMAQGTAIVAEKERITANGEYHLSGERYRETAVATSANWQLVALGDMCSEVLSGGTPSTKNSDYWQGDIPWITSADIVDIHTAIPRKHITQAAVRESATNVIPKGNVIVVTRVGLGKLFRNDFDVCISQDSQGLILKEGVSADFLVYVLRARVASFKNTSQGSTIQGVTKGQLAELQIPLPPLEVQREIVAEIEDYQRVINGARAVIDNYRPHIVVDTEWPMAELGEVCELISGQHIDSSNYNTNGIGIGYLTGPADFGDMYATVSKWTTLPKVLARKDDILITVKGSGLGKVNILNAENAAISRQLMAIRVHSAMPQFLYGTLSQMYGNIQKIGSGAAIPGITRDDVLSLRIPLPALEVQRAIVAELEAERVLVDANRKLIELFEGKIHAVTNNVWNGTSS